MPSELKVLILEDVDTEAELTARQLKRAGISCTIRRVDTAETFVQQLDEFAPDIILSDFSLPHYDGLSALNAAQQTRADTPFIFVSGTIGEETAIESLKRGATDYVLKTNLARLGPAVLRAVQEAAQRAARVEAEKALLKSNERLQMVALATNDALWDWDLVTNTVWRNEGFQARFGYTDKDVAGHSDFWTSHIHTDDRTQVLTKIRSAIDSGHRFWSDEYRFLRADGTAAYVLDRGYVLHDANGKAIRMIGAMMDITEKMRYQEQLERQANYDALTGLPNRSLLKDRLEQTLAQAQRYSRAAMVAFIDLDNFKLINDSLGHTVIGDGLLRAVGDRLQTCVRRGDTVARSGGDEFVLILTQQENEAVNYQVIERVMSSVSEPYVIDGQDLRVTCSVGLSLYPQDGADGDTLLRAADAAMYRAKELGKNNFQFYAKEMTAKIGDRLTLEAGLRRALDRGEFLLQYQPQVELQSGQIIGMEALIRWQHPELGMVSPAKFIPIAEETGLIEPIGAWVLHTACAQNKAFQDAGLPAITVAVNLSPRQFRQKNLVESVRAILNASGLDPRHLELEITEGMVMQNAEEVIATLSKLEGMRLQLSVDDFGTGYSNLSYLKRFPVHRLKIDKSFVGDIGTDPDGTAIAQSVIALGHSLNLKVIAEGVETAAQLAFLRQAGCDEAQGYYFFKPLPHSELAAVLGGLAVAMPTGR
jgi:diguanylate cyclase (GGDEF)-like protein/PAS domain S-box-containing protein